MNLQWKRFILTAALPVAMGFGTSAHALFLIDDFGALPAGAGPDPGCTDCVNPPQPPNGADHPASGSNWSYRVEDDTADANPIYNGTTYQNNMAVFPGAGETNNPRGWSRDISAETLEGDSVAAEICYNCQAGHHVSGAGGSNGNTDFSYTGESVDVSDMASSVMLDYAADQDGAVIRFTFDRTGFTDVVVETGPLLNTGNSNPSNAVSIMLPLPDSLVFEDLESAQIDIFGVADLDLTIDNVKLVPEPSVLALLSAGLLGLGWQRRRRGV